MFFGGENKIEILIFFKKRKWNDKKRMRERERENPKDYPTKPYKKIENLNLLK